MSLASLAGKVRRKLDPIRRSDDQIDPRLPIETAWPSGPVYMPQQPAGSDDGSMPLPNRRLLGMPVKPTYNPPQQIFQPTDPGAELQKRAAFNVAYNPPVSANAMQQPTPTAPSMMQRTAIPQFEPNPQQPQPTMADQYMSKAVLVDELSHPRLATTGAVNAAGPATVIYGNPKKPTFPTGVQGGADELERQQAMLDAQRKYIPENHNSRLRSIAIGLGRGYLQGGLVGAAIGGVSHGIDPSLDEKYANERDIAKTSRAVAQGVAYKTAQSKLQDDEAKRELDRAQAYKALNPTYRPTAPIVTDQGVFDRNPDGSLRPLTDPTTKKPLTKATTQGNYEGKKYVSDPQNPNHRIAETWRFDAKGNPVAKVSEQSESLVDGAWISSGQATTAKAAAGQREWERQRQAENDKERKSNKEQERIDKDEARRKDQGQLTGDIDSANQQIGMSRWQIQQLQQKQAALPKDATGNYKDPNDRIRSENFDVEIRKEQDKLSKIQAAGAKASKQLSTAHGDLYESGVGTDGFPYYKLKPFSRSAAQKQFPRATKAQLDAAEGLARQRGQEVIQ